MLENPSSCQVYDGKPSVLAPCWGPGPCAPACVRARVLQARVRAGPDPILPPLPPTSAWVACACVRACGRAGLYACAPARVERGESLLPGRGLPGRFPGDATVPGSRGPRRPLPSRRLRRHRPPPARAGLLQDQPVAPPPTTLRTGDFLAQPLSLCPSVPLSLLPFLPTFLPPSLPPFLFPPPRPTSLSIVRMQACMYVRTHARKSTPTRAHTHTVAACSQPATPRSCGCWLRTCAFQRRNRPAGGPGPAARGLFGPTGWPATAGGRLDPKCVQRARALSCRRPSAGAGRFERTLSNGRSGCLASNTFS